jgi:hypothetical protein
VAEAVERGVDVGPDLGRPRAELLEHGHHHAVGGLEQREKQMLGSDLGVPASRSDVDGGAEGFL